MARNPFRSEAEAYRFLLLTVGYFALIVAAAAIETWLGLVVFIGLTLLAVATVRAFRGHFTPEHHHGVEIPGIYWHFVDVMWIVVYATIYLL